MPVLTVEKPLRDKLGDEAVDSLVRLINQSREEQKKGILEFVEEKFERRLSEEMSTLKVDLIKEISEVDSRLSVKIAEVDNRLSGKISETKSELVTLVSETKSELTAQISSIRSEAAANKAEIIKWMFIFWIGQVAVILGILFAFFKR